MVGFQIRKMQICWSNHSVIFWFSVRGFPRVYASLANVTLLFSFTLWLLLFSKLFSDKAYKHRILVLSFEYVGRVNSCNALS